MSFISTSIAAINWKDSLRISSSQTQLVKFCTSTNISSLSREYVLVMMEIYSVATIYQEVTLPYVQSFPFVKGLM